MYFTIAKVTLAGLMRLLRFRPWLGPVREVAGPQATLTSLKGRGVSDTYMVSDGSGQARGVLALVNPWREYRLARDLRRNVFYRYMPPHQRFKREHKIFEVLSEEELGPRPRAVGSTFFLRDYVAGRTLASDLIKEADTATSCWWEAVVELLRFHALGLYHGDPRPENILITPSGLQFIDFEHAVDDEILTPAQCRALDFLVLLIHTERLAPQWLETKVLKEALRLGEKLGPEVIKAMATLLSDFPSATPMTTALVNSLQAPSPKVALRLEKRESIGRVFEQASAPPANFVRRLRSRWLTHAAPSWWGDAVDSRFLLAWEASGFRGCSILDIGCNAGVILSEVPYTNLKVGMDISAEALEVAQALNPSASFFRGDMLRPPYRDAVFDVVIFAGMLEIPSRTDDKVRAIREIHRVLKPDGRLLLTTPNRACRRYRRQNGVVTFDELVSIVGPYFEMEVKGFNPFPPFPWFLPNRLLARIPGIWHLLTALMAWERLTRRSCSFYVRARKKDTLPVQPSAQSAPGREEEEADASSETTRGRTGSLRPS